LTWDGTPACHLCGRDPDTLPTVGTHHQRHAAARRTQREDPYTEMAQQVLPPPERAAEWDPEAGAFIIDTIDD
jgi:hypothetical protein